MSVCSDELLALAQSLVERNEEASSRACVGRSYYALYHEAQIAAQKLVLTGDGSVRTAHETLINKYLMSTKGLAVIGKTIRKQKLLRAVADYDISSNFTLSEARLHLATSKRIVDDLRRISAIAV
jgi:uncharacterized protein (UPF0332 family)